MPAVNRREIIKLLASRLDADRLAHSLSVEKEAARLAAHHGEYWHKAALAGLLHDICRCGHPNWQFEYMRKNSGALSREWLASPQLWHGPCAAVLIRRELGVKDREILNAVRFHTTGRPGMTDFEKIIFLADKIEPTREYEGVAILRETAYRSLDEAIHLALGQNIAQLCKMKLPLVKEAYDAYNELTARLSVEK